MFQLVSVRHVGAYPGGHQHGVSIQLSIYLGETFLRISLLAILARNLVYLPPFISQILDFIVNPREYRQIHTPTQWYKRWGGGRWNPSPEVLICCSTLKRFYLQWKAFDLLNEMRYILGVVALLQSCDVTNNGCYLGRHLGFYQELEIRFKL